MSPFETIKNFLNNGGSLQNAIEKAMQKTVQNNNANPMFINLIKMADLIKMAEKGDSKGVENFARNLFKEQGRDFDKEYSEFKKNFKN